MATEKQIAANRRNALKSTGPRTPRGKAAIARNNLQHGLRSTAPILPGQDLKELAHIRALYLRSCQPRTAEERSLVDRMVSAEWNLRYWQRAEIQLMPAALSFPVRTVGALNRLYQRQGHWERAYRNACRQFRELTLAKPPGSRPRIEFARFVTSVMRQKSFYPAFG